GFLRHRFRASAEAGYGFLGNCATLFCPGSPGRSAKPRSIACNTWDIREPSGKGEGVRAIAFEIQLNQGWYFRYAFGRLRFFAGGFYVQQRNLGAVWLLLGRS